jgi:hypothetical protein
LFFGLNARAFDAIIVKLLKAGQRDRALKLCAAAGNATHARIVNAMIEAAEQCSPKDSRMLVADTIREAHGRARDKQLSRLRSLSWLAPLGVALSAVATTLAVKAQLTSPIIYAPPIVAGLLWLAAARKLVDIERASDAALDTLTPILCDGVTEAGTTARAG